MAPLKTRCICLFSSVLCDLSDRQPGNLYIISLLIWSEVKWSEYLSSAGFTVSTGSSICSHHTGALCIRQVIVVVISLPLPELWPLGSFLFCPRITSLKFLSCSPCAVPPFELYSGGAVVPTIASVMSWFSNPKFRRIFLETFYGDFWPFLLVFSTKVGNSRAKAEISLEE